MADVAFADLMDPAVIEDPYPLYAALRQRAPVWQLPGTDTWLVTSWDLVREAVSRSDDFSSNLTAVLLRGADGQPVMFDMTAAGTALDVLATADDPVHDVHRKLVLPHLVARRMAGLRDEVTELMDELWAEGLVGDHLEWASTIADRLPLTVVARIIGLPTADLPQLLTWAYESTELLAGIVTFERMAELGASSLALAGYLADHYAAARREPGNNLLGDLARAGNNGELSDHEVIAMLIQLVGAGGESTAGLIGNSARLLATRPDLQEKLRADPTLIPVFLEEMLRLESPFRGHFRVIKRDTELGGVRLGAGEHLMLLWGAANRDPAEFDDPDDVVFERQARRTHLAFGYGVHFCVGNTLARLEASIAITALLDRSRSFTLHPDTAPVWTPSIFVRRQDQLALQLDLA